ncbi:MAG TPA: LysM peptidoglycan-binding domain-containing protein [Dehalococcoidia bacterium]
MPEFLTCFACEQEPTQQCPRCGRPYCDDHGEDVCDACLNPASGLPSFTLYRGSLLALLVGTALAVWLLIQPPGGESNAPQAGTIITPTPQVQVNATQPAGTAQPGTTPGGNATARPNTTPTTAPSGGSGTYTVVSGDSLSSICTRVKPASMSVPDCVESIVSLNSLSSAESISPGQTLKIPQ